MTTKGQIDVLQAYLEGRDIQVKFEESEVWDDVVNKDDYQFDFSSYIYRVKPRAELRPYDNAAKFINDMKAHGPYLCYGSTFALPITVDDLDVVINGRRFSYKELRKDFRWQDGHQCGTVEMDGMYD